MRAIHIILGFGLLMWAVGLVLYNYTMPLGIIGNVALLAWLAGFIAAIRLNWAD